MHAHENRTGRASSCKASAFRFTLAGAFVTSLIAFPAYSQAVQERLDLSSAVAKAVQNHPSIRGSLQQINQAEEIVKATRAQAGPQISGGLENRLNTYRNTDYGSRNIHTARLNVSQLLFDFGKLAGATRQAEAGVRVSEAQSEQAINEIALVTVQAWIDLHLQASLLDVAREQLLAVTSITDMVRERVEKGATSRSDLVQATSRVEALRSQLLGAEAEAERASLTLMYLTGSDAPVEIEGDIPPALQGAACLTDVAHDPPAVEIALGQRDDALAQLDIAKAQRFPTITLDGTAGLALTNGSRLYGERTTGQVGVNVSMPFYQGGAVQARERGALYQLRAFEGAVAQARLENRQGLADAKAQKDGWARRGPALAARIQSIDATRELYRLQYLQLGTRSLLDLLNAEQEYFSARVDETQGVHSQYQAAAQCLYHLDGLRDTFQITKPAPPLDPAFVGPLGQ